MASNTPIRSKSTPFSNSILKSKSVFLHEWWLVKPQNHCNGFAISGITSIGRGERVFVSTVIVKVHETNVVETQDGIIVGFRGFINSSRSFQNGFSSQVCQRFSIGFPHSWKKLSARLENECDYVDRVNDFGVSNTPCHKEITDETLQEAMEVEADKCLQEAEGNDDIASHKLPHPQVEVAYNGESKVSDFDDLNASFLKKTADVTSNEAKEAEDDDTVGSLRMPQLQVDVINTGENGVSSVAAAESNQSKMGVFEFDPVLEQSSVKSPLHPKKLKLSSDCKENNERIKQTIVEDPGSLCRRVVTRSIAKNSLIKDRKVEAKCFTSPVRRSSRGKKL